ncbi:uncharacterized protein LOC133123228 [Conger conger]|uniref:uncharacterized protein LOC133123217 n=1 Tax=Conger conger TaxID=82655 RepID=UPI002A5A351D|nr:uncharacterized protein LOC133123217 [Conger conger]XP_061089553.1 uncharacterized protein LOC133123228 [Conger conger]
MILNYQSEAEFFNHFKNSTHLSAKTAKGIFNLTVLQAEKSDSATYYCTFTFFREIIYGDGTTLIVTGESPPGIIHTHGHRSDECQRSSGTVSPTQSCVYNFPKRILSHSDAGTYYCAVATCGEILFGNGTKLDFKVSGNEAFLYCLAGALALSVILHIVLALRRRKSNVNSKGAVSNNPLFKEDLSSKKHQDEVMNYAALTFTTNTYTHLHTQLLCRALSDQLSRLRKASFAGGCGATGSVKD